MFNVLFIILSVTITRDFQYGIKVEPVRGRFP